MLKKLIDIFRKPNPNNLCIIHHLNYCFYCYACQFMGCSQCYDHHAATPYIILINARQSSRIHTHRSIIHFIANWKPNNGPNLIYYYKNANIVTYNPATSTKAVISYTVPSYASAVSISFGNKIFINGGKLTAQMVEVVLNYAQPICKAPMKYKRHSHSLCCINRWIYAVGGYDMKELKSRCEKYDINKNKWETLPNMNSPKTHTSLFSFNSNSLYSCGGWQDKHNRNMAERLNIVKASSWVVIAFKDDAFGYRNGMSSIQINEKQVLIFGGMNGGANSFSESHILDIFEQSINATKASNLRKKGIFWSYCSPIMIDGCVYAVDESRNIHCFSQQKGWDIIEDK